jgi:NAD(P)-dependent dehydrogenase (short-subunit alcohol dehydrogenase family)
VEGEDDLIRIGGQSKLALTIWSQALAQELGTNGPVTVAVNPGSLLATKMVKEGYGIAGNDIGIGADILVRAATTEEFAEASGRYFDNDAGRFAPPHADASDPVKVTAVVQVIETLIADQMKRDPHD